MGVFLGTGAKCLIAVAIGAAIGISPWRDSAIVNAIIEITGGRGSK